MPDLPDQTKAVIERLAAAFPEGKLDPLVAFGDGAATFTDYQSFARGSRGKAWRALGWKFLDEHREAIGFLSPEGFVEYLPAFLTAAVGHYDEVDVLPTFIALGLTKRPEEAVGARRFKEIIGYLSADQQTAVAAALRELERLSGDREAKAAATAALDSYWRKLLLKQRQ